MAGENLLQKKLTEQTARLFFGLEKLDENAPEVISNEQLSLLLVACANKVKADGFDTESEGGRLAILYWLGYMLESRGITATIQSKTFTDFAVTFAQPNMLGGASGYSASYKQHKIDMLGLKHRVG